MTLKIEDLDEFEGVTADMVRAWLRAKGWTVKRAERFWEWWEKGAEGEDEGFWLPAEFGREWFWIHALAAVYGLSVQSLLREINPRMRAGWPSTEEITAHDQRGGLWICDHGRGPSFGRFAEGERFEGIALEMSRDALERLGARFWPCDQHGNKVRRGA